MTQLSKPRETSKWSEPVRAFFGELMPKKVRTMREFAEEEIILPSGPRAGMRFRVSFMPWTGLVFDAIDSGDWRRIFARGSVQSGKSLIFTVIPTLYHLCEMEEDVIFCAPTAKMAWDIWKERCIPTLKRTRFNVLFPTKGIGSRGGQVQALYLTNGAILRFMGAGGGDEQRSSYTARVIIETEIDKMDVPGEVSRESDPLVQFEARATTFGDRARIYGECTTSYEEGRIFQETEVHGTGTRINVRCPHCRQFIYPERDFLVGWREAETIVAARRNARYQCQNCQALWTAADRRAALIEPLLVHKGQTPDEDGTVTGPVPETFTFGVVWNAMLSGMVEMGDIAEREFRAEQTQNPTAQRELAQFVWSVPFKDTIHTPQITYSLLAKHCHDFPFDPLNATGGRQDQARFPIPEETAFLIGTIDVQKRVLYYAIDAFARDLTRWTLVWEVREIVPEGATWDATEQDLRRALDGIRQVCDAYHCDSIWVDTGYRHEGAQEHVIRIWCAEQGDAVHALVGRSEGAMGRLKGSVVQLPPETPDMMQARLQSDGTLLWFFDVDRIKDELHYRLFREFGAPGYHHFPREAANAKRTDRARGPGSVGWIFSHYMRAKRTIREVRGRRKRVWEERGRHDLWDCAGYALGGAMVTLADILDEESNAAGAAKTPPATGRGGHIRTEY